MKDVAIAIMIIAAAPAFLMAGEPERLADINRILTAYQCVENGKYHRGAPVVTKVSLGGNSDDISQIEGIKDLLDTPEEFITAAYYSDVEVINEMKDIPGRELPKGKTGALRIASMWLKKCAEDRTNCGKYGVALDFIKKHSDISDRTIRDYFRKAIENEIHGIAMDNRGSLSPKNGINNEICAPLIAYYTHPDNDSEKNLINAGVTLFNNNRLKADLLTAVLIRLNENFATTIINKIHKKRSGKSR